MHLVLDKASRIDYVDSTLTMVNVIDNFITLQFLRMTIATTSFNRLVFSFPKAITPAIAAAMVLKNIPPNMNEMVKLKIGAR